MLAAGHNRNTKFDWIPLYIGGSARPDARDRSPIVNSAESQARSESRANGNFIAFTISVMMRQARQRALGTMRTRLTVRIMPIESNNAIAIDARRDDYFTYRRTRARTNAC